MGSPAKQRGAKPRPAAPSRPPPTWLLIAATAVAALAVALFIGGRWSAGTTTTTLSSAAQPPPSSCAPPSLSPPLTPPPSDACWPAGDGCPAAQLEAANAQLAPLLGDLVRTPFFRYFKVSLTCGCPFWREEDGMCALQDCAVCECPDTDVPPAFTAAEVEGGPPAEHGSCRRLGRVGNGGVEGATDGAAPDAPSSDEVDARADPDVDRWVDAAVRARLVSVRGWRGIDNPWMDDGGGSAGGAASSPSASSPAAARAAAAAASGEREYTYIDLTKNPERYTGYKGPAARRVWEFIYSQACFAGVAPDADGHGGEGGEGASSPSSSPSLSPPPSSPATCGDAPARRTFFRIMSGVHASITAHIAGDYLMNEVTREWGPNLALYAARLGGPSNAWRRSNLRFAHAFVARAVAVAGPLLDAADYRVGGGGGGGGGLSGSNDGDGAAEHRLVHALLASPGLASVCGAPWDGAKALAVGGDAPSPSPSLTAHLTAGMQAAFRNVTAVMDCVGCEKCRLWGKLQLLGVATALKVLVADAAPPPAPPLTLERNEAVALVNLFDRLARSVGTVAAFEGRLAGGEVPVGPVTADALGGAGALAAAFGM